jgi:hypothetical protein
MESNQKIVIDLPNGLKLVAERNPDKAFENEIFIGIMNGEVWHQDLAIVRNSYDISKDHKTQWRDGEFEVIVFGDKDIEDYTHKFEIGLYKEEA